LFLKIFLKNPHPILQSTLPQVVATGSPSPRQALYLPLLAASEMIEQSL